MNGVDGPWLRQKMGIVVLINKTGPAPELLSWQQHTRCRFVSFLKNTAWIFPEILFIQYFAILHTLWPHHFSNLHNRKTSISPKRKTIFQKGKCRYFFFFWKACQISCNYFSCHRHFKRSHVTIIYEQLWNENVLTLRLSPTNKANTMINITQAVSVNHCQLMIAAEKRGATTVTSFQTAQRN